LRSLKLSAEAAYEFPDGHTREESLWRTLCCGLTTEIPIQRAPVEYEVTYKVLWKQHEATNAEGRIDLDAFSRSIYVEDLLHYIPFYNTVWRHCVGRNLCITTRGYFGGIY
jgi:hypothetical protein